MTTSTRKPARDPEFEAYESVFRTLEALEVSARVRVIRFVLEKLDMSPVGLRPSSEESSTSARLSEAAERPTGIEASSSASAVQDADDEGISPIARKWVKRNNMTLSGLANLFSIGGEEVDLIAATVPGESKRARLHNVFLLRAVAAYLASGVARVTFPQLKEVASHYDAVDDANFASNMKAIDTLYTGSKQSGYTLNARGLAEAATLVKGMLSGDGSKNARKK